MKVRHSCGIVPLRLKEGEWWVFLVQHRFGGHWSFPKGHREGAETPLETAERELSEETALRIVRLLSPAPFREQYHIERTGVDKIVDYFIAEVEGEPFLQVEEIAKGEWFRLREASALFSFPEIRELYAQLCRFLNASL